MAYSIERREFLGGVEVSELSSSISNSSTSISLLDGSSFPTGEQPFVLVIARGTINEEKVLCSSRTGNTVSVSSRGYDGTSALPHSAGASVDHVFDATAAQSMNTSVFDNTVYIWLGIN